MSTMLSADDDNETLTRRWQLRGGLDLASKHLAYHSLGERATHHSYSWQVVGVGVGCSYVWLRLIERRYSRSTTSGEVFTRQGGLNNKLSRRNSLSSEVGIVLSTTQSAGFHSIALCGL